MLDTGLKEWAVVCDLLLAGRFCLLLRKGGIHEDRGPGVFTLEYPRFVLFPAWSHQQPDMLKAECRAGVVPGDEPAEITLRGCAVAARIWQVTSREAFDQLDDLHPWSPAQIDMRFNYKPERPLYLLALRAARLREPRTIRNHAQYTGCRSWVPLREGDQVDDAGAMPTMDDATFDSVIARVERTLC